jgi:hypothetical protein
MEPVVNRRLFELVDLDSACPPAVPLWSTDSPPRGGTSCPGSRNRPRQRTPPGPGDRMLSVAGSRAVPPVIGLRSRGRNGPPIENAGHGRDALMSPPPLRSF